MKKTIAFIVSFLLCLSCLCFVACDNKNADPVVIKVDASKYEITSTTTLNDYMNILELNGELDFTTSFGAYGAFITSVNGVSNGVGGNPCWMVYTDDPAYKDLSEWGTKITIGEKEYVSATMGISGIIVSDGYSYVLYYTSFNL